MDSTKSIVESFAYYYLKGASSELFIEHEKDFEKILFAIDDLPETHRREGYGGTSSMMALRAF